MNLLTQLQNIQTDKNKQHLVKRYLLQCCNKLARFRSPLFNAVDSFRNNVNIANRYLKARATKQQMHQAHWETEAYAFAVEHYSATGMRVYFRVDKQVSLNLRQVRIAKGFTHKAARVYLQQMAYFIERVFSYIQDPVNSWFDKCAEAFLCPRLFQRMFSNNTCS